MLNPVDLQILVRLGEGLTQGQVASELGIEQPAVSKALRAAQTRLGLPLLQADGRRTKLTAAGTDLARAGAPALRRLQAVEDLVASLRAGRTNRTRIVASTTPGTYLLPQVVARFLRAHPDAQVDVEVIPMRELWSAFITGAYDVAVAPTIALGDAADVEAVYRDPVVIFAAASHPLASRSVVRPEEMRDEAVVGKFREVYWGQLTDELRRLGYRWARQVDLRASEAVKRYVASGRGIGVLFASTLHTELASGELVALPVVGRVPEQTYGLLLADGAQPLAGTFCAFLREAWSGRR